MALCLSLALLLYQLNGSLKRHCHRVFGLRDGHVFAVVLYVRTEASCTYADRLALELAESARETEQLECLFQSDGLHALV